MNYLNLFLELLTFFALISALAVITSTNPVLAIVFLIILFLNVGIYLILMGLQFIGLSYLLVYVGAITVLFLFIVMMLSVEVVSSVEVGPNYSKLLPLAYLIAILFLILFIITIPSFFVDFTSGAIFKEIYSIINQLIFNYSSASVGLGNSANLGDSFFINLINRVLDGFDFVFINLFGATNSILHPLAWAPENMGNDSFSLFISDSLTYQLPTNLGLKNNVNLFNLDSMQTAQIENYNLNYLFNQPYFVELNNSLSAALVGNGDAINPTGFYYFHPSVYSELAQNLSSFQSVVQNNTELSSYLFPLGWYSDDPYTLFTQWASNKNINLFLWHNINPAYFTYFDPTTANWGASYEFQPWVNILFANTATNVNYAGAAFSPWFTSTSVDLVDIGLNVHSYRNFMLPSASLHNYALNISWLGIPYFPEFLVEFPQSPVFSPLYYPQNLGGVENDFGTVYHIIERYNSNNENISLINDSVFGNPSTLLHKNLQITTLGQSIYGPYSILLILSSFLLLLAMVCPIVLARNSNKS